MDKAQQVNAALNLAVTLAGGQTEMARKLTQEMDLDKPLKQAHVWNWLNRGKPLPPEYVIPIERIVSGQVTRHQLRPDIYPRDAA